MATENSANTASTSRSNSTADSYIGSLISLTSKSEIRYEGVLYNINTEESSIGLKNVRSFGTEGRKKDGPQIPPSDKVYEYILFRGSDIKDLQVKSSPPAQPTPTPPINNDPAIIQSHYPRPVATSASLPPAVSGSLSDIGPHNAQIGLTGSNFQGGLPLYQPGGNIGTWGASPPPPSANGNGLAMPMYWQGYYAPPNGLPHLHQQSLLRPPPGLSMPPPIQQPMQYSSYNAPLHTGAPNLPGPNLPTSNLPVPNLPTSNLPASNLPTTNLPASNLPTTNLLASNLPVPLPDIPSPLLSASTGSLNLASTSSAPSTLPATLPSTLPSVHSASLASETIPSLVPNKTPSSTLPAANLSPSLPALSPLTSSGPELNTIIPPLSNKSNAISGPTVPYQSIAQPTALVVPSNSLRTEAPTPSLVTPGQLLQSGPTTVTTLQPVQTVHKDVEVVQVSSTSSTEPSVPVVTEAQPPILPLPVPARASHKPNGAPFHSRQGYRGRERGRGTGNSHPVTKFTEDFDFMAMNEKFKKDEVWGHLGKSNKKDREDGKASDEDDSQEEDDDELNKIDTKPVYNKDDFFDTLSCNALDHDSQNGRPKFSEQLKIDTETFGDFPRYRGGRGGHGPPRGGRSRGSYHGRGYGYNNYGHGYGYGYGYGGRGRGRGMPNRSS
ncbi:protein decapping 5 [Ricinus communis]|uniref:protein decapping 5 n=1 Tax=Ricinus communis TaxID=3988 RepID=UPI00201AC6DD|nr:protein decapping 5 [Ricinus communis]